MSRHLRSLTRGGVYHVMNRGNRKQRIFEDVRDRTRFLRILIEEIDTQGVDLLAGAQVENHFHLIVRTPYGNLSDFMARLEGRFARYSNWRHGHVGHLFQGRFRDVVIEHDIHLLIALCYVFLNPLRARLVARPEDYKWSTYAATAGFAPLPDYLCIDWLTSLFPSDSVSRSQLRFRSLMAEAKPVAAYLNGHDDLGPDPVRRVIRSYVGEQVNLELLPRPYRSILRSQLPDLIKIGLAPATRSDAIYEAHVVHGYKLAEIARQLQLHPATVSKIFRRTCASRRHSAA